MGILLTGLAGFAVVRAVPNSYQASGQLVLLLSPNLDSRADQHNNPYLVLPNELNFVGSLVVSSLTTKESERDMAANGYPSDFSLVVPVQAGPVINIAVEDTVPERAIATRDELIRRIDAKLTSLQQGEDIPASRVIRARENIDSATVEPLSGSRTRALAVVLGLGLLLTAVGAFVRDGMVQRRKARKLAATRAQGADADASSEPAGQSSEAVVGDPSEGEPPADDASQADLPAGEDADPVLGGTLATEPPAALAFDGGLDIEREPGDQAGADEAETETDEADEADEAETDGLEDVDVFDELEDDAESGLRDVETSSSGRRA